MILAINGAKLYGQTSALQIEGPRESQPGQLVRLVAKTVPSETPFWIVLEPIDLDYEQVDGGQRLLFSTGCLPNRRISVLLLAQRVQENRIVTRQIRRTIVVGEQAPVNPPVLDPPPVNGQEPAEPIAWEDSPLFSSVLVAWPEIRTDVAKGLSSEVAASFDSIADQIDGGQITHVEQVWTSVGVANREILQVEVSAWEPVGQAIQLQFKQLKLSKIREHAFHLRSVAAAIRQAFNATTERNTRGVIQ